MKPIDDLKEEHLAVKQMLEIVDGICIAIDLGKEVDYGHLESVVEFMKVFVDKCHHTKEENYLFPEMEKAGIAGASEMVPSLLQEHELGRWYVGKISEAVSGKASAGTLSTITENSRAYIQLLTRHIKQEENNLFPMADACLSQEVQKELMEAFERVEIKMIGAGKHEEFHSLLHNLKKVYVKTE